MVIPSEDFLLLRFSGESDQRVIRSCDFQDRSNECQISEPAHAM